MIAGSPGNRVQFRSLRIGRAGMAMGYAPRDVMNIAVRAGLLIALAALSLVVPLSAVATEAAPAAGPRLTLVALTDLALSRNPRTRLAWAALRASEAGVALARAGYWPQVDATLTAQRNRALSFSGTPARVQTRYGASIGLSYLLWDFGTRGGELDRARFEDASARLSRDQTLQDVILATEQAYYQVVGLDAVAAADGRSLADAETSLAAARDRKATGLATVGDVYKAEAARAGARLALQQAEGRLAVARGQLAAAVGEAPDTSLPLAPWEEPGPAVLPERTVGEFLADARDARPELLAAKAREQAAAAAVRSTRGRGLPILPVTANAGRTRVEGVGASSQFSALLSLDLPLFAGFGDRAAVAQAEAALETARATTDDLRAQVELEVWQAYQDLRTAAATLESSAAQLKSASQAADVSAARYKNGLDTILDLLVAQSDLADARVQEVQARLDWAAARTALGHAVGGLRGPTPEPEAP
jgi:outer membrane protein